jgi:hypothetical protein
MDKILPISSVFVPSVSKPMSFHEALSMRRNYNDLAGKLYVTPRGNLITVEAVIICPYDNLKKWIFINLYARLLENEQQKHLSETDDFDVVLLVSEAVDDTRKQYSVERPEILREMFTA